MGVRDLRKAETGGAPAFTPRAFSPPKGCWEIKGEENSLESLRRRLEIRKAARAMKATKSPPAISNCDSEIKLFKNKFPFQIKIQSVF